MATTASRSASGARAGSFRLPPGEPCGRATKAARIPGRRNSCFVDAHHIQHWAAGGETRLDNLLLLCSSHHRLVHEGGYRIDKDIRDRWIFRRPDGIAVPACGYRKADRVEHELESKINDLRASPRSRAVPDLVKAPAPPD